MADELERWLDVADNRGEWARLRRALGLETGFALFTVDVPDVETEGRVVELLRRERVQLVMLDARSSDDEAPVRELLRRQHASMVLRCVEASRRDGEALERCLVQLNARRDQIAARGHVLVVVLRRDAVVRMLDVAPDLYSVHRARFRFARLVRPRPAPMWLLTDQEFAAVVDHDEVEFAVHAEPVGPLASFDAWAHARPNASESVASRILARYDGVRCLVDPPPGDLASALAAPTLANADVLRESLVSARETDSHYRAYLCAAALCWVHLQRADIRGASEAAADAQEFARRHDRLLARRSAILDVCLGGVVGAVSESSFRDATAFKAAVAGHPLSASIPFTLAEIEWERRPGVAASRWVRVGLDAVEMWMPNPWRLASSLRSLAPELVTEAIPPQESAEAMEWLRKRYAAREPNWARTWTVQLMVARALGLPCEEFSRLAWDWLYVLEGGDAYEVWRPFIDIHIEARSASIVDPLVRMALGPDATHWFPSYLPMALMVAADAIERGLVRLSDTERDDLRIRAAARAGLPLAMRLGWWAIELALGREG